MTEEQKELLKEITKQLNGKLSLWVCSDKYSEHKKIVIEYAQQKR